MDELPRHRPAGDPARSSDLVADAYDRGRPSYPEDAVTRLLHGVRRTGTTSHVLEVGAGTGKLTEQVLARGCAVTAVDPSHAMLTRLRGRAPGAHVLAGTAEQVPVRGRSADLVVAAQAFHRFRAEAALTEAARVLRPGGRLAVIWSERDERIPWVRRLGRIIGTPDQGCDPTAAIDETAMFAAVDRSSFRFWQPLDAESLRDLVASRSHVAALPSVERERVLREVDDLYAEYGRGHDGMLLPYVTTLCRTTVLPWAQAGPGAEAHTDPQGGPAAGARSGETRPGTGGSLGSGSGTADPDDDALLIDFR